MTEEQIHHMQMEAQQQQYYVSFISYLTMYCSNKMHKSTTNIRCMMESFSRMNMDKKNTKKVKKVITKELMKML